MIIGRDNLVKSFSYAVDNNKLSHAYIFFGNAGVGKFYFAKSLASYIEHNVFDSNNNAEQLKETLVIDCSLNEPKNKSVDVIRVDASKFLYQKPVFSQYRVVIIRDANLLTIEAQNALLKLLEEPPEHGVIILISNSLLSLLSTIASRTYKVYFPRIKRKYMLDFIKKYVKIYNDLGSEDEILDILNGSPGKLLELIDLKDNYLLLKKIIYNIINNNLSKFEINKFTNYIYKIILNDERLLDIFIQELLLILKKDIYKNYKKISEVSKSIFFMKELQTYKYIHIKNIIWKMQ